jgi:hypothetical protein
MFTTATLLRQWVAASSSDRFRGLRGATRHPRCARSPGLLGHRFQAGGGAEGNAVREREYDPAGSDAAAEVPQPASRRQGDSRRVIHAEDISCPVDVRQASQRRIHLRRSRRAIAPKMIAPKMTAPKMTAPEAVPGEVRPPVVSRRSTRNATASWKPPDTSARAAASKPREERSAQPPRCRTARESYFHPQ